MDERSREGGVSCSLSVDGCWGSLGGGGVSNIIAEYFVDLKGKLEYHSFVDVIVAA